MALDTHLHLVLDFYPCWLGHAHLQFLNLVLADLVHADLVLADLVLRDLVLADLVLRDLVLADLVLRDLVLADLVLRDLVHADLVLAFPDLSYLDNLDIHHTHDLDNPENFDSSYNFVGPLNHPSWVHTCRKPIAAEEGHLMHLQYMHWHHLQLGSSQLVQLSSGQVSFQSFVAESLASQHLGSSDLLHLVHLLSSHLRFLLLPSCSLRATLVRIAVS